MSEGTDVELALRDLQREIEKIEEERDRWKQVSWLAHKVIFSKWEYTQFEQAYEEAVRGE